jgi:transcription antitermination factor NusG
VVLELTRLGEQKAEEGCLPNLLRDALKVGSAHPVFVPCVVYERDGTRIVLNMMEGYVFIATGLSESVYIALEHDSPYIRQVLCHRQRGGVPVLSTIPDSNLDEIRGGLRKMIATDIKTGMQVDVVDGPYAGLSGNVVELQGDNAAVYMEMRSLKAIRSIPRTVLRPKTANG